MLQVAIAVWPLWAMMVWAAVVGLIEARQQ